MNIHKNARTNPHIRGLIVSRVLEQNLSPRRVAEELGVSLRTVYKWLSRYRLEGPAGLQDRSSTALRMPHRLPDAAVELITKLRREFRMTARAIARQLGLARSTVAAVLKRLGLNRLKLGRRNVIDRVARPRDLRHRSALPRPLLPERSAGNRTAGPGRCRPRGGLPALTV